jgi:hypothetical protein
MGRRCECSIPNERRLEELRKWGSPIYDSNDPKHNDAMTELRRLLAAERTPEEQAEFDDLPIGELRHVHGLEEPRLIPALQERWDSDQEANFISYADSEGMDKALVRDLYAWYVRKGASTLGDFTDDDIAEFREKFGRRLTRWQIDQLIRWHQSGVQPRQPR